MSKKQRMADNLNILENEFEGSSDETDGESSDDDSSAVGQMVDVHFEGFTAAEDDFHGIKRLLCQTFRGMQINLTNVADAIITQNYVGSVIKEVIDEREAMEVDDDDLIGQPDEEGDFIFGLNTILNLTKRREENFVKDILSGLKDRCSSSTASDEMKAQFKQILSQDEEHVGLLINERLVNLPCEVALPAFSTLQEEVTQALNIQLPYSFKYVVMICKVYKMKTLKTKKKQKKTKNSSSASANVVKYKEIFSNEEEQVLSEYSVCDFQYSVNNCSSLDSESWNDKEASQNNVTEFRKVIVIPADKMTEAVQKAVDTLTKKE